jgi:thymidylate synthase ThyX
MIKVQILLDSQNHSTGDRITTFLLTYPRFIHSELMTHRAFSRNAASSRAIPVAKMIDTIRNNPAMPVEWGSAQKGMQAGPPLEGDERAVACRVWRDGLQAAIATAEQLMSIRVHKQIANRVLEPWMHMLTLVTATEWGNFFRLRAHPDAQPEFQELAFQMLEAYKESIPQLLFPMMWHAPFVDLDHNQQYATNGGEAEDFRTLLKVAVARCARTSYATIDGHNSIDEDVALHDRLLSSGHFSPFEHIAKAMGQSMDWGNFRGWRPYRHDVEPDEQHRPLTMTEIDEILARRRTRSEQVYPFRAARSPEPA